MRWTFLLFLAGGLIGCSQDRPTQTQADAPKHLSSDNATAAPADSASAKPATAPAPKPYVLHLPGVSGTSIVDYTLRAGLVAGGFDGPFEIYDWTCHDPGIPALHNRVRNEEQAQIVADMLTKQFRAHPGQPIYLVCHSGGSGPATWALEKLPPDVKVACFLMLAPALSPQYDLSKALAHVTGHAYCFNSESDDLVLGTGTRMFGTIDGERCDAAGRVGFKMPATGNATLYAKLIHKPYESAWAKYGHIGGHIGCTGTPFVQAIVAPLLLGRAASEAVLNRTVRQPIPDVLWPK
ncbi:MAG TPA: hypothetical protein VH475_20435 [Tepidisphaeraceae bacterium]